jgi:hypothetical protein
MACCLVKHKDNFTVTFIISSKIPDVVELPQYNAPLGSFGRYLREEFALLMFGQVWMFNLHDISEDDSTPVVK